jgi:alkylation response protein AidB-like acyl-CoA dehydrogenase
MNLDFSPEDVAFRDEVRAFIAENYPAGLREKQEEGEEMAKEDFLSWHRTLAKKGWVAPGLAREVRRSGLDLGPALHLVGRDRPRRLRADPAVRHQHGRAGDLHLRHARAEGALPAADPVGRHLVGQGYSEPGAGSDLASLKTKAERFTGDDGKEYYLVNGQKTWTTLAQHGDWIFCLVRTDPTAKIQEGISFLLIDMKSPGVTVRPIITLGGEHEVNEVWLENVKVPVENRIYDENKGWTCAKFLLAHERSGIAGVARSKRGIERIRQIASTELGDDGQTAADRPGLQAQGRRSGDRPDGPGIHRAAHPGRRGGRQGAWSGVLGPEDQGHRDPAAHHRTGAGSGRPLRRAVLPRLPQRRRQRPSDRPGLRPSRGADLFQRPQDVDLRRLQRDPAQHHRQDGAGALAPRPDGGRPSRSPRLPTRHRDPEAGLSAAGAKTKTGNLGWISTSPKSSRWSATRSRASCRTSTTSRPAARSSPPRAGWRADYWKAFAEELGILGASFSEELGGLGGGAIDNMIIMEEFGKALVIEPYLGTVVIGGGFMKHSGYARRLGHRGHRRRDDHHRLRLCRTAGPLHLA